MWVVPQMAQPIVSEDDNFMTDAKTTRRTFLVYALFA